MAITKVGIVGGGLMGSGIAQVAAQSGYDVMLAEVNQDLLDRGMSRVYGAWEMLAGKGRISGEQAAAYRGHIRGTLNLQDFADRDVVIEAIIENLDEKKILFTTLDGILPAGSIIVSNTSSLPIMEMAAVTGREQRIAGLHFESLGKTPIVAQDTAGFVVNFLLIPYMLSAVRMYENGIATKEDIDTGMKLGCGYPMGPFELLDYVGLDTTLYAAEAIYKEYPDPAYAPPTLLRRMVQAGRYGRKNGKGFYVGAETDQ